MSEVTRTTVVTLDNAFRVHNEWKNRLKQAAQSGEPLDVATIKRDDCCDLGQWLKGEGQLQYGRRPEFQKLLEKHRDFHTVAGIVASMINKKSVPNADAMLQGSTQFSSASTDVLVAIMALKSAVVPAA